VRAETFSTPGPVLLNIEIPAGEIRLETGDEPETRVELDTRDEDALAAATIELRTRDDGHEVVVAAQKRFGFRLLGAGTQYSLRIRAPHGADVELSTGSADVEGRGRFGAVEINDASGDARLDEIDGDVRVNIASGDVRLGRVGGDATVNSASGDVEIVSIGGRGKIRSASGDVSVGEAKSALSVATASGDQEIGSVASGQVTVQSASGDIEVGVAPGATLWIDAKSMSGETISELEVEGSPPADEAAQVELRANSMSGDIRVRRA
jgi:DUF4097 and DUF4098 domain-containing protein YvlB